MHFTFPCACGHIALIASAYDHITGAYGASMRTACGSVKHLTKCVLRFIRHGMLQFTRLLVDLILFYMESISQEYFQKPVPSLNFGSYLKTFLCERCTLIWLIEDQAVFRQVLNGLGHARRGQVETFGYGSRPCGAVFASDIINGFQVFLDLFRWHPLSLL